MATKIRVTEEHIANGIRSNTESCPVALAILDATGWNKGDVDVGGETIDRVEGMFPNWNFTHYHCPKKVQKFVDRFDEGKPVRPFSFVLKENPNG